VIDGSGRIAMNTAKDAAGKRGAARGALFADGNNLTPRGGGRAAWLERFLLRVLLESLGSPPLRCVLWDGSSAAARGTVPECDMHIRDRAALWRLMSNPEYEFPALYVQGRVLPGDQLGHLLEVVQRARCSLDPNAKMRRLRTALMRPRRGSPASARDNIHRHYDLGNDFYRLWLDEQMVYTCAYFATPQVSLEAAQKAKLDLVCRKLRLRPGERVVEAGCGWGALALHMARHYGVKVRAFNISQSQLAWARERAAAEGLEHAVEFVDGDYREIAGSYDAFVSVGMLEHVGPTHYPELAAVMDRCLSGDGRGLIHTIGTDRPGPLNAWIERHIFPGARPPSLGEMMPLFEPSGFSVQDIENLRLHYALTLHHWHRRFEDVVDKVLDRYGPDFVRAWRFYLVSSEAAFRTGQLQLFQVLFSRKGSAVLPWSRADIYRDADF
jgi:cyclopropane-fatty-acyl-phospholipid synthase